MPDEHDSASELEELQRHQAITSHLARVEAARLRAVGICHNCDERVPPGMLFCDADCSADHELRMRARRF